MEKWLRFAIVLRRAEGLFERWTLRRQQFRAALGNVHVVFQANAELTADVHAGLVTERHMGCQRQAIAPDQVRPLVAVHPQPVAHAMREVQVAGAIAGIHDDLTRGGVYGLARYPGPGRGERRALRMVDD